MIACAITISPPPPTPWTARKDQLEHVLREPDECRADQEDHDRDEDGLAAEQVAELSTAAW